MGAAVGAPGVLCDPQGAIEGTIDVEADSKHSWRTKNKASYLALPALYDPGEYLKGSSSRSAPSTSRTKRAPADNSRRGRDSRDRERDRLVSLDEDDEPCQWNCRTVSAATGLLSFPVLVYACAVAAGLTKGEGSRGTFLGLPSPFASNPGGITCGLIEERADYTTGSFISRAHPIRESELCQQLCNNDWRCKVWSHGLIDGKRDICLLKGLEEHELPVRRHNYDTTSGVVCKSPWSPQSATPTTTSAAPGAADAWSRAKRRGLFEEGLRGLTAIEEVPPAPQHVSIPGQSCGEIEENTVFETDVRLYELSPVFSAEECQEKCEGEFNCAVWTWGKPTSVTDVSAQGVCYLKGKGALLSYDNWDFTSGLSCEDDGPPSAAALSSRKEKPEDIVRLEQFRARPKPLCDLVEADQDYSIGSELVAVVHGIEVADCMRFCKGSPLCGAWTWRPGGADTESMGLGKWNTCKLLAEVEPSRKHRLKLVSGLSCHKAGLPTVEFVDVPPSDATVGGTKSSKDWYLREVSKADGKAVEVPDVQPVDLDAYASGFLTRPVVKVANADAKVEVCPIPSKNTDFKTDGSLSKHEDVPTAAACQQLCTKDDHCGAWSWGDSSEMRIEGVSEVCWLKVLEEGAEPDRSLKAGIISGLPCFIEVRGKVDTSKGDVVILGEGNYQADLNLDSEPDEEFPRNSLYCFALMQPKGYEKGLIQMQHQYRASLFGCDEAAVYSNEVIEIADGVYTLVVDSDLKCELGGEFNTAMNTPIFLKVWEKVIELGRFRYHEWSVKVDPDCVFFPWRLRQKVKNHQPKYEGEPVYINNCHYGLHGPIEVLNREAVQTYFDGVPDCEANFKEMCEGDCFWGEDIFMDQCFMRVLKVRRDTDETLLMEDHCDPPADWASCTDGDQVAFHPFKTEEGYKDCMFGSGTLKLIEEV